MYQLKKYSLLLGLTFIQLLKAQSPSFNYQKFGSEEGLNNANIFSIDQHTNGLMYFATQNGVYTFDGYNFSKLQVDSLKSNALLSVSVKQNNRIYFSLSDEGIAEYNQKNLSYKRLKKLAIKNNNADNFIITDSHAYLLTWGIKLTIVDLNTGEIIKQNQKSGSMPDVAYCLFQTKDGKILVGKSSGLYEANNGQLIKQNYLQNQSVYSITETKSGQLIIGTSSKLIFVSNQKIEKEITPTYNTKGGTFQPGGSKSIDKLVADNYGRIWFVPSPGENLFLLKDNIIYNVFENLGIAPTLINCLFKDKDQNIWIGTFSDGAYCIQNTFFDAINFSFNNKNLSINQVLFKENLLIAATSNGLYGLDVLNYQTKTISKPDEMFMEPINSIVPFNNAYFYTKRNQFETSPSILMNGKNNIRFKPIIVRQFLSLNNKQSITADWSANILLCNADATQTLDTLISFPDYRIAVNSFLVKNNLLYIATNKGLFTYHLQTKKFNSIIRSELNYNINDLSLINDKIYAAHEAGITEVESGQLIQQVGELRLNSVKKIKYHKDYIWLATLDGAFICNKNFEPIKTLNKSNGLLSNSVNDVNFNNNTICVATDKGVALTNYNNIVKYSSRLKPVSIKNIVCNGELFFNESNNYAFNTDQENITINFYSPLYTKPNRQFFKWKQDKGEWNKINNMSFEVLLTGGNHQIDIIASSDNITWSNATTITIKKAEKFSEKKGIYFLLSLGSLILVLAISFIWVRRVKIKAKKRLQDEQQVNLLKHQAMNALLSPHFIFNSLTSIQNYINTNNSLRASEYLAKFSRLIRMIIEKAAQSEISLHDELARLTYYLELEKERFKNKFDYKIELDDNINTHEILIPNMIIQPHVENCILHGILPKHAHGELKISFRLVSIKKLVITIEDNGIGLIKAKEHSKAGHKSLGTTTIENILEINSKLNGKKQKVSMIDKSTIDPTHEGTLITIEIER